MNSEFPIIAAILLGIAIYFLAAGAFSAMIANEKGRDGTAWFVLGACFGPLALLALIGLQSRRLSSQEPMVSEGANPTLGSVTRGRRIGDEASRPMRRSDIDEGPVGEFLRGGKK